MTVEMELKKAKELTVKLIREYEELRKKDIHGAGNSIGDGKNQCCYGQNRVTQFGTTAVQKYGDRN
jgi:hypothetical protein